MYCEEFFDSIEHFAVFVLFVYKHLRRLLHGRLFPWRVSVCLFRKYEVIQQALP
jgi:hypothetical protein